MDFLWDAITEWLKELLVGGITSNLSGMFDSVNEKVAEISGQVGMTPQGWNGSIYNMIHNLSETVIVPIAGVILHRRMAGDGEKLCGLQQCGRLYHFRDQPGQRL